jgi:serine phosphatase RsbU (regulator of sigma subunit)
MRGSKSLSIRAKLALGLGFFSTLTLASLAAFILWQSREALVAETTNRGILIGDNLASYSANALLLKDTLSSATLVADAMQNEGMVFALLTDQDGRIVADGSQDLGRLGQAYAPPVGRELPAAGLPAGGHLLSVPSGDDQWLLFELPVTKDKVRLGTAYVALSQAKIQAIVTSLTRDVVVLALGFLAFGLLGALLMAAAIARPVRRLTEGAVAIGQGRLDTRIKVRSRDEIGVLAESFNEMAGNLQRAQAELLEKELLEKDLNLAREIQARLIPKTIFQAPGYSIAGHYQPALMVGGDYFDVLDLGAGRVGLVVADVSGKGVSGSLGMAMARAEFRAQALQQLPAVEVLTRTNAGLVPEFNGELFVTLYYALLDVASGSVECASGGHGPAYIVSPRKPLRQVHPSGAILGVFPEGAYPCASTRVTLEPGETLVLATDGVVEARNASGEFLEEDRFLGFLQAQRNGTAEQMKQAVLEGVAAFAGDTPQHDDITLLFIHRERQAFSKTGVA